MPKKKARKIGKFLAFFTIFSPLFVILFFSWFLIGNIKPAIARSFGVCFNNSQCAYNQVCDNFFCRHAYYCWHNWCDNNGNWCHGGYHFSNHQCIFDDTCGYNPNRNGEHADGYVMYKFPNSGCPLKSSSACLSNGGNCIRGSASCPSGTHSVGSCDIHHRTTCCLQ